MAAAPAAEAASYAYAASYVNNHSHLGATAYDAHKFSRNAASFYKGVSMSPATGASRPEIQMVNSVGSRWSTVAAVGVNHVVSALAANKLKTAYCFPTYAFSHNVLGYCTVRYP